MIKTICDFCGAEIESNTGGRLMIEKINLYKSSRDVCDECFKDVKAFVTKIADRMKERKYENTERERNAG